MEMEMELELELELEMKTDRSPLLSIYASCKAKQE